MQEFAISGTLARFQNKFECALKMLFKYSKPKEIISLIETKMEINLLTMENTRTINFNLP